MAFTSNKTVIKIIVAALSTLLVLLVIALIINVVKLSAVNARKDSLQAQSDKLDQLITENGALLDYVETPEYIEDFAREYLDMIYRDEIIIEVE